MEEEEEEESERRHKTRKRRWAWRKMRTIRITLKDGGRKEDETR
jgi:hypothetical protein